MNDPSFSYSRLTRSVSKAPTKSDHSIQNDPSSAASNATNLFLGELFAGGDFGKAGFHLGNTLKKQGQDAKRREQGRAQKQQHARKRRSGKRGGRGGTRAKYGPSQGGQRGSQRVATQKFTHGAQGGVTGGVMRW